MPPTLTTTKAHNHEEIEVSSTSVNRRQSNERTHIVRQDRYEVKNFECEIVLGTRRFPVLDYSVFGVAIHVENSTDIQSNYPEVPFFLEGIEVARLHVVRVRQQQMENGVKVAFEIIGEPLNLVKINAILNASQLVNEHQDHIEVVGGVPAGVRKKIYELKDTLEQLEDLVEALQSQQRFESNHDIYVFESSVADVVAKHLKKLFDPAYEDFAELLKDAQEEEVRASFEFFRVKLRHLIHQSAMAERFYSKPLGYAGDFGMMNFIYRNEDHGKTLFAKCIHRYFMDHPFGKAVRNRAEFLKGLIYKKVLVADGQISKKILSVASGPAKELQLIAKEQNDLTNLEFHLLDQDMAALHEAQRVIRSISRTTGRELNAKYLHKAIRNLFRENLGERYDLIYSAGLFDYFSDPVAKAAAKRLFEFLKPGGVLAIGNFTAADHSKMLMELAFDWHLTYRTKSDLLALYDGVSPKISIESEPEGVNLFVMLYK